MTKGRKAALKAWETIRQREAQMSPAELKALHQKRSKTAKKAAYKAWETMNAREEKMTEAEKLDLAEKRSNAAKKAWRTMRAG
jgi:hypothetical protein